MQYVYTSRCKYFAQSYLSVLVTCTIWQKVEGRLVGPRVTSDSSTAYRVGSWVYQGKSTSSMLYEANIFSLFGRACECSLLVGSIRYIKGGLGVYPAPK